jgi:hypothetical protein
MSQLFHFATRVRLCADPSASERERDAYADWLSRNSYEAKGWALCVQLRFRARNV